MSCFYTWVKLASHLNDMELVKACIIAWAIWDDRNKFMHLKIIQLVIGRYEWILDYAVEVGALPKELSNVEIVYFPSYDINSHNMHILHVDAACVQNTLEIGYMGIMDSLSYIIYYGFLKWLS